MRVRYVPDAPAWPPLPRTIVCETGCVKEGFKTVNGRNVPLPRDASDPIPLGHAYWLASTPDNSISTDWIDLSQPRLRFAHSEAERRYQSLSTRLRTMMDMLPPRPAVGVVTARLNAATVIFPSMWLALILGAVGLAFRPEKDLRFLIYLAGTGLVLMLANSFGLPATPHYRAPFDPYFALFGIAGLVGSGGISVFRVRVGVSSDSRSEGRQDMAPDPSHFLPGHGAQQGGDCGERQ